MVYSLVCITTIYGINLKMEYLKATWKLLHTHLKYPWNGQSLDCAVKKRNYVKRKWEPSHKKWDLDPISGEWTRALHIQQIVLLSPAEYFLYVKATNVWRQCTYWTKIISTSCDPTYIRQAQVENPPEWKIIASIEHRKEDHVSYQGESGRADPDNMTSQCLEEIWKE